MEPPMFLQGLADFREVRAQRVELYVSISSRWRSHGYKGNVRAAHGVVHRLRHTQLSFADASGDHLAKSRFGNCRLTVSQQLDLVGVYVHPDHMMSMRCKAPRRHASDVPHSENREICHCRDTLRGS